MMQPPPQSSFCSCFAENCAGGGWVGGRGGAVSRWSGRRRSDEGPRVCVMRIGVGRWTEVCYVRIGTRTCRTRGLFSFVNVLPMSALMA